MLADRGAKTLGVDLQPAFVAYADKRSSDESGTHLHFVLDDYTNEGPRRVAWRSGHEITNFHRMLSTTVNDFLDAGFVLRRLHEPVPNEEQLSRYPENEDMRRVPIFTVYDLEKPASMDVGHH
jgi:hypothetical protein